MCTLDKSHTRLMAFLNTREINSMLDYDTLDIGKLDITASPKIIVVNDRLMNEQADRHLTDGTNRLIGKLTDGQKGNQAARETDRRTVK
jgi:hypothetical protein